MNAFRRTYGYYPGCSAHSTGVEFDSSLKAVCRALDVDLREIKDWNCCGATSASSLGENLAVGLPARNLALIEKANLETIAPCAACFHRLRSAQLEISRHPAKYRWLQNALETPLQGTAVVRSMIDVLFNEVGLDRVFSRVRRALRGLRVVTYYGCLLVRPKEICESSDAEHPHELDALMATLGAIPCQWSFAVDCCGGALSISRADVVRRMTERIVEGARAAGAEMIITACPLCQANLEMRQNAEVEKPMPALYFTETVGLAFDLPDARRWWKKHLIDPRPVLRRLELL